MHVCTKDRSPHYTFILWSLVLLPMLTPTHTHMPAVLYT